MRNRDEILSEVIGIYREIEDLQGEINKLYEEAKQIIDKEDDENGRYSYLENIRSYITYP
jgi:hypothetical protein